MSKGSKTSSIESRINEAFLRAKLAHPESQEAARDQFHAELKNDPECVRVIAEHSFDEALQQAINPEAGPGDESLKEFLDRAQFAIVAVSMVESDEDPDSDDDDIALTIEDYLNSLAAAQVDPARRGLVHKMLKRIAEDGFDITHGAYYDLLPG